MPLYLLPLSPVQVLGSFVGLKAFICTRVVLFKTFSGFLQATDHFSRVPSSPIQNLDSLSNPGDGRVLWHIRM